MDTLRRAKRGRKSEREEEIDKKRSVIVKERGVE